MKKLIHGLRHHRDWRHDRDFSAIWTEKNPSAEIRIWDFDEVVAMMEDELARVYETMPFLLQRANMLRLVLLEKHGGIYLDLDVECMRSLDNLFEKELAMGFINARVISNAVLGARAPHHPLWRATLDRIASINQRVKRDTEGIRSSGAELLTNVVDEMGLRFLAMENLFGNVVTHHAGRPAWVGKQYIGGELHENRSEYANR